jgi:hypothetical protein
MYVVFEGPIADEAGQARWYRTKSHADSERIARKLRDPDLDLTKPVRVVVTPHPQSRT